MIEFLYLIIIVFGLIGIILLFAFIILWFNIAIIEKQRWKELKPLYIELAELNKILEELENKEMDQLEK